MGSKALCLALFCVLFASHIYVPLPGNIEERWKVMALDAIFKTFSFMVR